MKGAVVLHPEVEKEGKYQVLVGSRHSWGCVVLLWFAYAPVSVLSVFVRLQTLRKWS